MGMVELSLVEDLSDIDELTELIIKSLSIYRK